MGAWFARWRVALRIAWRDALRNKGRTVLVVAMVALPLVAGTVVLSFARTSQGTPESAVEANLGPGAQARVSMTSFADYLQTPDGYGGGWVSESDADPVPIDLAGLRSVLGVDHAIQPLVGEVDLVSDTAALPRQWFTQVDEAQDLAQLFSVIDGRLPERVGEVAISPQEVSRLGVDLGDVVTVARDEEGVELTLVGILGGQRSDRAAALTGSATQGWGSPSDWMVLGDAPVTWEDVLAANERGWKVFSRAVVLDPPPDDQVPYYDAFPPVNSVSLESIGLVGAVLAMGLLEIVLLIGPAFAIGARRSARQLAVVAASGGTPTDLRRIVRAAGVVTGVLSAVLGIALGIGLSFGGLALLVWIQGGGASPSLVLPTWELAVLAAVAVVLGVGAAWMPARTASRQDVVITLAGRRGSPRPTRGLGRLGAAVVVLGALVMALGVVTTTPVALVAGVLVLEVGVIVASGSIVAALGRLAPRLGVAGRFAIRDSVRNRSRTAPAVAAVVAAVAAATAAGIYQHGEGLAQRAIWKPLSADPGLQLVYSGNASLTDSADEVAAALQAISTEIDPLAAEPIQVAYLSGDPTDDETGPTLDEVRMTMVVPEPDPELDCETVADPRCVTTNYGISSGIGITATVVDDGSLMAAARLPGWQDAAAVLETGGVVVPRGTLWPDDTARLQVATADNGEAGESLTIPAYGSDWPPTMATMTVLSPDAAERLGLATTVFGALITTTDEVPQAEVDRLNALVRAQTPELDLLPDRPRPMGVPVAVVLVGVAAVVALVATGLAVGLAGADMAPDLATLAAIGAPPRVRRRVAAAQAGVLAGTGSLLGAVTGIPIGLVLSHWGRTAAGYGNQWPLAVPWQLCLLVAVPVIAYAATYLFTRSRLPMVRRNAE